MSTSARTNQQNLAPEGQVDVSIWGQKRRVAIVLLVGLSLVYIISLIYRPADGEYFTLCGFKNFTGLPCPGCGLTHSFCAIGKGELGAAFAYNLIGPPLFAFSLLLYLSSLCVVLKWWGPALAFERVVTRVRAVRLFAIAFAIFGLARIFYLVLYNPASFHNSPLSHLLARFF